MADVVGTRLYSCFKCQNCLARQDDIISKSFKSNNRKAFLFSHVMNIVQGTKVDKMMITGMHTVSYIYCKDCGEPLGWKYERAFDESQKYKEGKFVLENIKIVKGNWWQKFI